MPIICQCKWPFRSYSGNKLSTGTQLLVSTEDDFNRQCLINQSTLPTQRQSYVNASGKCTLIFWNKYLCGRLLVSAEDDFNRQCFINQSTLPILCQCIWPTCSYTGNKYLCGRLLVSSEDDFANLHSISQ